MGLNGDLIDKNQADSKASFSVFSDPAAFYTYSLIATETADSIESVLSNFPEDFHSFVKKTLIKLEEVNLISYENGKYKQTKDNRYSVVQSADQAKLYPELFSGSVKSVINHLDSGSYIKNREDFSIYSISDSPQTKAELKALSSHIDSEIRKIITKSEGVSSNGVRIFGYVNALPKAEDFL